jgi:hypothetical protein
MDLFRWIVKAPKGVAPSVAMPDGLRRMLSLTFNRASAALRPDGELTFEELERTVALALDQIMQAAKANAEIVAASIAVAERDGKPISDVSRRLATPEGIIEYEGSVPLLADRIHSDSSPFHLQEIQVSGVVACYAIFAIDCYLEASQNNDATKAIDALAIAYEAIEECGFLLGWAVAEGALKDERRQLSAEGGRARNAPYKAFKTWVVEQYEAGLSSSPRKWSTPHQASHKLRADALVFAKQHGMRLSENRVQQTIYEYLLAHKKHKKAAE